MSGDEDWTHLLETTAESAVTGRDEEPDAEPVRRGLRLVWATAGAVQAAGGGGELWWLAVAEAVIQTERELLLIPFHDAAVMLGIGPAPQQALADTPALRAAAAGLLVAARDGARAAAGLEQCNHAGLALWTLGGVLADPPGVVGPGEALMIAQARTRIYRTAARLIDTCLTLLDRTDQDARAGLAGWEYAVAVRLRADLAATVEATGPVMRLHPDMPGLPDGSGPVPALTRIADLAEWAWDNLVTDPITPLRDSLDARGCLAVAAGLAHRMAVLDAGLGPRLMAAAAAGPATPQVARILRQVGPDCSAITALAVAGYTRELGLYDGLDPAVRSDKPDPAALRLVRPPPDLLRSPDEAAAATGGYLAWLRRHSGELTVEDLSGLAATAARLCHAVTAGRPALATAGGAAAEGWRWAHHTVRQLETVRVHSPPGYGQGHRLAEWADRHARDSGQPRPLSAHDRQALAAIAARLPELAELARAGLQQLHVAGQLLTIGVEVSRGPVPDHSPDTGGPPPAGRAHLAYVYQAAGHLQVAAVAGAFTAAGHATAAVSSLAGQPGPAGTAHPARITEAMATTEWAAPVAPDSDRAATPATGGGATDQRAHADWRSWDWQRCAVGWTTPPAPSTPDARAEPSGPATSRTHRHVAAALRAAAGPALAGRAQSEPAWPALIAAAQTARGAGWELRLLLKAALTRGDLDPGDGVAAVLAGRIRRITSTSQATAPSTAVRLGSDAETVRTAAARTASRTGRQASPATGPENAHRTPTPAPPVPHRPRPDRGPAR